AHSKEEPQEYRKNPCQVAKDFRLSSTDLLRVLRAFVVKPAPNSPRRHEDAKIKGPFFSCRRNRRVSPPVPWSEAYFPERSRAGLPRCLSRREGILGPMSFLLSGMAGWPQTPGQHR